MQTEYTYPALGDRTSPKEWAENKRPDLLKKAISLKKQLLSNPSKAGFSKEVDDLIRKNFSIYLN
jgi:trimethylamine--corrinoid protein Co-methyltransferase